MRIVLDTNIVVSIYLARADGTISCLRDAWEAGAFEVAVSESILAEYRRVLNYPYLVRLHGKSPEAIDADIARIRRPSHLVEDPPQVQVVERDPTDDQFFSCTLAGRAEIIVSGDPDLLEIGAHQGVQVLSPFAFLALITPEV